MMTPTLIPGTVIDQCFSAHYAEARDKFRQFSKTFSVPGHAAEFGYRVKGPRGEELATGLIWQGDRHASRVLVIQSATHGVEGFAGSAIQLDTLAEQTNRPLPDDMAILYLHAINPYGFAWLRRTNEDGIDLNRNFIDFGTPLPENPGYAELADALLPDDNRDWENGNNTLSAYRKQHGRENYELAVSGGQYQFPDGLFYGGHQASQSRLHLEQVINELLSTPRRQVAVIDVHTGLGPYGYGEIICDHPPQSSGLHRAKAWYGHSVTEPALGSSTSVPKTGLIDYLWQEKLGNQVSFVTLEFGTYSLDKMLDALRRDHMIHRRSVDWADRETIAVKQMMRDFFYPATPDWQEMVLLRGRQVIRQALNGLMQS